MGKKFNMVLKTLDTRREAIIDELCRLEDLSLREDTTFPQPPTEEERDILGSRIHDLEVSLMEIDFIRSAINGPVWSFEFYNRRYDNHVAYKKMHEKYYWFKKNETRRLKDGE